MARDVELLQGAENGGLGARVYRWDSLWVTLGHYQRPEQALRNPARTPHVIRPTGGKAVVHGHDVTVGIAAPLALLGVGPRELKGAYRSVTAPIIAALRDCGVRAALAEQTPHSGQGTRTADCFAFKSANDIIDEITGQKLCGCALKLTERAVLLQASIPRGAPLEPLEEILLGPTSPIGSPWDPTGFEDALERALLEQFPS